MVKMSTHLYEIQHFGFTPEQMTIERKYMLNQFLEELLQEVLDNLGASEDTYPLLIPKKSEILSTILEDFKDKLEEIESCDKSNFSIPPCVLLPQDFELSKKYTEDDLDHLETEVSHIKNIFLENSIMIAALELENSQYEQIDSLVQEEQELQLLLQESYENQSKNVEVISNIKLWTLKNKGFK